MPEGDTVLQVSARLHHALAGSVIVRTEFRVPSLATADLADWRVLEVIPVGKHLLMRLRAPRPVATGEARASDHWTLHSHLMMDGMWRISDIARPAPRNFRVRAIIETDRVRAYADDVQAIVLVPTQNEQDLIGHLGPDLLNRSFDEADVSEAVRRIESRPARRLSAALMDQRNSAGIGNIYRNETLFLVGASPMALVKDLPPGTAERAVRTAHKLLDLNKFRLPRSTTGLAARRVDSMWVYLRGGRPCRRCGTIIEVGEFDDAILAIDAGGHEQERDGRPLKVRYCWWCSACQTDAGPAEKT